MKVERIKFHINDSLIISSLSFAGKNKGGGGGFPFQ